MKILFVWTGVTGYMADAWRELSSRPGVELNIVIEEYSSKVSTSFKHDEVMHGLDWKLLYDNQDPAEVFKDFDMTGFNAVFICGWRSRTSRWFAKHPALSGVKKTICADMPWRFLPRCFAARFVLRGYLKQFDSYFVPGASAARYARWLGFSKDRIKTGMYSVKTAEEPQDQAPEFVPKPAEHLKNVRMVFLLSILNGMITVTNAIKPVLAAAALKMFPRRTFARAAVAGAVLLAAGAAFFAARLAIWNLSHPEEIKTFAGCFEKTLSWIPDFSLQDKLKAAADFFLLPTGKLYSLCGFPSFCPKAGEILSFGTLFMAAISAVVNLKTSLVKMMLAMFSVDVVIHLGFFWGMDEPFVFAGHWIWMVPVLIGLLFKRRKKPSHSKIRKLAASVALGAIFVFFIVRSVMVALDYDALPREYFGLDYKTFVENIRDPSYIFYTGFRHPGLGVVLSPLVAVSTFLPWAYVVVFPAFAMLTIWLLCQTMRLAGVTSLGRFIAISVWFAMPSTQVLAVVPESFPVAMAALSLTYFLLIPRKAPQGFEKIRRHGNFMYLGRFVREKRLDILFKAYSSYRKMCAARKISPRGLDLYGTGDCIPGKIPPGVKVRGFVQPAEVRRIMDSHSALVQASDFEPWGVALLESCAAGMPVVCTHVCHAADDLFCGNGAVVAAGDWRRMAASMFKLHIKGVSKDAVEAAKANALSKYSCKAWADTCIELAS